MKRWYVVQVHTGFEDVVKKGLEARIAAEDLSDIFGEVLVPTGQTSFFAQEEEVKKEKIFPGYVLVQVELTSEAFLLVTGTPRVLKFLGGETPMPLSNREVEKILDQVSGKVAVTAHKEAYVEGTEVNIAAGPFTGFVGIVETVDEEHEKLTVMVSIFGRLTPVELQFGQVKK